MNCCSNNDMTAETLTSMFQGGCTTVYAGITWLLSLGKVFTQSVSDKSVPTNESDVGFLNTDSVVSILFIVHVAAVVAFIVSHCRVTKKKSD